MSHFALSCLKTGLCKWKQSGVFFLKLRSEAGSYRRTRDLTLCCRVLVGEARWFVNNASDTRSGAARRPRPSQARSVPLQGPFS